MRNFINNLVLHFIVTMYLMAIVIALQQDILLYIFRPLVINQTYVAAIKGDSLALELVKNSLDYFNNVGDNKIIDYSPKFGNLSRPITITVREPLFFEEGLAGRTLSVWGECYIYIAQSELDDVNQLRETVIHEYLHCLGYQHVLEPNDVMYWQANYQNKELSIYKYALEIKRWKIIKN